MGNFVLTEYMSKGILKITSNKSGKTVVIMAGVHGNEKVGGMAVDAICRENVTPSSGTVYFIKANLEAIEKNVRLVESNMNRCFSSDNKGITNEEKRAKEIMSILDEADVLLDIHSFNDEEGEPFVIADGISTEVARILNVPILSTNWDSIHSGSADGYMNAKGKIGICIECGPSIQAERFVSLAVDSIRRIFAEFEISGYEYKKPETQTQVSVQRSIKKETEIFSFSRTFKNFEKLKFGEVFAKDGEREYTAEKDECIIFPRPNAAKGGEVSIIGKYL